MSDVVSFSPWLHWDQRSASPEREGPGVYLLGRFEEGAPTIVDPADERVLLIAETHGQSLADRWYQFHRCAFNGADGHSGGRTFHRLFTNGPDSPVPGWLHVAATGVPAEQDPKRFTQHVKQRLLTDFEERHGILPRCNTNGPAGAEPTAETLVTKTGVTANTRSAAILEPPRTFSRWLPWADRKKLPGGEFAGIYALARFESEPPPDAGILDENIVYIGETCENSLVGRLAQFNRSAFLGKDGHSGGWTYRDRFADTGDALYVSVCPVADLAEPHRSAFIRWAERQSLWDYVKRWGRRPVCNSK